MAESDLLTLTQWLSPAFPLGSFAYSHGLETAIARADVTDAQSFELWLRDVLRFGAGRVDAVLLIHAMDPAADLSALAALARALAPSRERHAETMDQGANFVRTINALNGSDLPAMALPVALGAACQSLDLRPEQVAALYLQAFASNLVSVAVRFVPLGQTEGQAVLTRLRPIFAALAQEASGTRLDQIGSGALAADMAAMEHETQEVRLFKT